MPLVTVLFVLTMAGAVVLVIQTAGAIRLVVDSKVKPVALVGQVRITLVPEGLMASSGGLMDANVKLKTVPYSTLVPGLPPLYAVPYRVLPDRSNAAFG